MHGIHEVQEHVRACQVRVKNLVLRPSSSW